MKSQQHIDPEPTKMKFGNQKENGKKDSNSPTSTVVIRHDGGATVPAGNPKNKY